MSILSFFGFLKGDKSSNVAKERLKMVLSYERRELPANFAELIQKDLVQVFEKYPQFNTGHIEIDVRTGTKKDQLSISIPFKN